MSVLDAPYNAPPYRAQNQVVSPDLSPGLGAAVTQVDHGRRDRDTDNLLGRDARLMHARTTLSWGHCPECGTVARRRRHSWLPCAEDPLPSFLQSVYKS